MTDQAVSQWSAGEGSVSPEPAAAEGAPGPDVVRSGQKTVGTARLLWRGAAIGALAGWYLVSTAATTAILALRRSPEARDYPARRLVALLERLGPAFIKAGQILGTRRDEVPRRLCDHLSRLQDDVAPMAPERARRELAAIYGVRLEALFPRIDYQPVASGSVACVLAAQDADGRKVAIKLQRPDIHRIMETDLAIMTGMGRLMARLPYFRGVPVQDVLDHLCAAVRVQLDFAHEADCLERLRTNMEAVPRVWVPDLHRAPTRPRAIVMEYIDGLDVDAMAKLRPALRKRVAETTLNAVYHMLFVDGFVHCDLHPGNLYFLPNGQIVVLDAGFSIVMSERMRRLFTEFFLEMSLGRGKRCAEIVIESASGQRPDADLAAFRHHMADLVHRNHGLPARAFSLIAFATEMFELQRRYGLHAATELVFPLLSLLVIEGTIRELDPDIDFQETAKPILTRGAFGAL
ncbi:MAG: AarF/UbiB family protein [Phyllobacteriaceae bacterium]|nr:AarF/UbiB family protein [Phyllobacteriaceae bacterium]